MYHEYLSKDNSIAENIQHTIFDNSASLLHEYNILYAALYDNYEDYIKIIKALSQSNKGLSRKQLVSKTKIANGGTLTKIINNLILSDFVDKYYAYNKKTKSATYKLKKDIQNIRRILRHHLIIVVRSIIKCTTNFFY